MPAGLRAVERALARQLSNPSAARREAMLDRGHPGGEQPDTNTNAKTIINLMTTLILMASRRRTALSRPTWVASVLQYALAISTTSTTTSQVRHGSHTPLTGRTDRRIRTATCHLSIISASLPRPIHPSPSYARYLHKGYTIPVPQAIASLWTSARTPY